jgi:hypothetical protein
MSQTFIKSLESGVAWGHEWSKVYHILGMCSDPFQKWIVIPYRLHEIQDRHSDIKYPDAFSRVGGSVHVFVARRININSDNNF